MTYQEKYQKARHAGYSDEEIMEFISQKDPSFGEKMQQAQDSRIYCERGFRISLTPQLKKKN